MEKFARDRYDNIQEQKINFKRLYDEGKITKKQYIRYSMGTFLKPWQQKQVRQIHQLSVSSRQNVSKKSEVSNIVRELEGLCRDDCRDVKNIINDAKLN